MFHWLCPECGSEIAPGAGECPNCVPVEAGAGSPEQELEPVGVTAEVHRSTQGTRTAVETGQASGKNQTQPVSSPEPASPANRATSREKAAPQATAPETTAALSAESGRNGRSDARLSDNRHSDNRHSAKEKAGPLAGTIETQLAAQPVSKSTGSTEPAGGKRRRTEQDLGTPMPLHPVGWQHHASGNAAGKGNGWNVPWQSGTGYRSGGPAGASGTGASHLAQNIVRRPAANAAAGKAVKPASTLAEQIVRTPESRRSRESQPQPEAMPATETVATPALAASPILTPAEALFPTSDEAAGGEPDTWKDVAALDQALSALEQVSSPDDADPQAGPAQPSIEAQPAGEGQPAVPALPESIELGPHVEIEARPAPLIRKLTELETLEPEPMEVAAVTAPRWKAGSGQGTATVEDRGSEDIQSGSHQASEQDFEIALAGAVDMPGVAAISGVLEPAFDLTGIAAIVPAPVALLKQPQLYGCKGSHWLAGLATVLLDDPSLEIEEAYPMEAAVLGFRDHTLSAEDASRNLQLGPLEDRKQNTAQAGLEAGDAVGSIVELHQRHMKPVPPPPHRLTWNVEPLAEVPGPVLPVELSSLEGAGVSAILQSSSPARVEQPGSTRLNTVVMVVVTLVCVGLSVILFGNGAEGTATAAQPEAAQEPLNVPPAPPVGVNVSPPPVEVAGFRLVPNPAGRSEIHYLVINHHDYAMEPLTVNVTLRSPRSAVPIAEFAFLSPELDPYESREMISPVEGSTGDLDMALWQDLDAEIRVSENYVP